MRLKDWLKRREHNPYNFEGRLSYLLTTILIFVVSIVGFSIFYSNAQKLNNVNLWRISLGGVFILVSCFFIIKYGWRLGKEIINILKRQKNWLKYLIVILLLFFLWQGYVQKETVLNPLFNIYQKTDFSLFSPIDLSSSGNGTNNLLNEISNLFKTDPEQYRIEPKTVDLGKFNFVVYGGVNDYLARLDRSISYSYTPPSNKDFIMRDLDNEIQRYYLQSFVQKIQEQSTDKNQQARIAINLVQSIPYDWDSFKTDSVTGRYPYEVLYDMRGVCMEKSDLLAFTLRELGFGVAIFEFQKESHRAVGIKCNNGNYGGDYCFIESTDSYPVGKIPSEYVGGVDIRNAIPEIIIISEGDSFN
ncbi:MAG: hypothetical protein Q7R52_03605 [archaeon]|nr:hypothetical protein [archaeon]